MSDCCSSILDLGCIGFCDTIVTGLTASATDTFVISLVGAGGYAEFDFTIGQAINFTNPFNEDTVTVFQVLLNGTVVQLAGHDCFQIKVNAGMSLV